MPGIALLETLITNFKRSYNGLRNDLSEYSEKITIREETFDNGGYRGFIFDIIVLSLPEQDDYGLTYSLTIQNKEPDGLLEVELAIVRGNGILVEFKDFLWSDKTDAIAVEKEFNSLLGYYPTLFVQTLKEEYLNK